ncbi:MAG: enoyl-CoA hydratase/isomerase family protein [Gammaproteobacteria bacterium]|nr:enoyl-CoA hydratase/isomerase family protein [Gammaproteobacteria bacterium]NNM20768.1 3-hydroxyacyl-CoA dehydrogenase [Gammaproteobacteria bacterium]
MTVSLQRHGKIAVISVDNPPVNALSHAVRTGVVNALAEVAIDDSLSAAVLLCAGRTFFAGADIREFGKPMLDPSLRDMLAQLDAFPKLTVAAIHGTALGGGLETALCCNYRIIAANASVGLPESNLGLLPGAGGTQRLPRLAGAEKALDIMIQGKPVPAATALALNIVDRIADNASLQQAAVSYARELLAATLAPRRTSKLPAPDVEPGFFAGYRKKIARRTRGFEAPERIVQCVEAATQLSFDDGMARERDLFIECMESPQSAAMRYLFFAERAVAKVPGIDKKTAPRNIETVGVIGAGTMGAGIALACMNAGLPVILLDNDAAGLQRGVGTIEKLLDGMVSKGRIDSSTRTQRFELLHTATEYASLADCDLVIEAVFESMAIKEQVFAALDSACKPGAILASNTSTLDIDRIAAATGRPADVIGLHFFSPANIMRLLEIVRGRQTSDEIIVSALRFARQISKLGVVVGNCFGFVGNRMLYGYGRESQLLLLEGATPQQIDKALTDFGMAMGPNAVGDLAGLDVGYKVRQERTDLPDDPRYYRVADLLAEMGRYGQKTGAGTYRYEQGSRTPIPDPVVGELIEAEAVRLGVARRQISDDEIVGRCIYALVIEGATLLEEKIAARPGDIDAIWANGYGFPRYRGGPMFYADTVGLAAVISTIKSFAGTHGESYWPVPPLLEKLAAEGRCFSDLQE